MEIEIPVGFMDVFVLIRLGKNAAGYKKSCTCLRIEVLGITENRYSGIPTIRREMEKYHLREPVFLDERGNFAVIFYKKQKETIDEPSDAAQGLELFAGRREHEKKYVSIWDYPQRPMRSRSMSLRWWTVEKSN